jgi:hypothetical protein
VTARGFIRDNVFLVAAVSLPLLVVAFFLISTMIPRWRVAPPAFDLLLRTEGVYDGAGPKITVDYAVRDGRVEATVKPLPANTYVRPAELFLFDHETMAVRPVPVELPQDVRDNDPARIIVVEALAGRKVVAQSTAPDGYQFENRVRGGAGIVGDLFGMSRYDPGANLVNKGRVISITLPIKSTYYSIYPVGWVMPN